MNELECDVAVIGAGPTGLTLANWLGAAGIRTVLVERNESTVQEPRAVSIDDESLRSMQAIGLIDRVLPEVALQYGSRYLAADGSCFAEVKPKTREYGFPRRNAFSQPVLEATLRAGLDRFPVVTALFGHECDALAEQDGHVGLDLRGPDGRKMLLRASYAVGCDGARSGVRKTIDATLTGSTYRQRWLIVDLGATRDLFRETRVFCDPQRPALSLPGPRGLRRFEFMLRDHETDELATAPDFVASLLAAHGPDADAPVVRRQVYTFHARIADRWRAGRIFLAGDAAHLSPPFAGQGMNSGVRDAHNLAWKLAAVVQGRLGPGLLDSYQTERAPHAAALIQLAVNMGRVMMPTSPLQARMVQTAFRAARVIPPLHAYFAEMKYKPKPHYGAGFLLEDDGLQLVGRMLPQPTLERIDGSLVRLDDLMGDGFALVACGPDAQRIAAAAASLDWGMPAPRTVAVLPTSWNLDRSHAETAAGRDVEGQFAAIAARAGNALMLVRPDRYVAAACDAGRDGAAARMASAMRQAAARTWEVGPAG